MSDIPSIGTDTLLRSALPSAGLSADEAAAIAKLQAVIDADIAPAAVDNDARGRYPTESIAALKRSGILHASVPKAVGGPGASHRLPLEAQVRLAMVDSAVAQIYKIHDELTREIFVYCPDELRPWLASEILERDAILGLAVAESGKRVDSPWTTTAIPHESGDGSFVINGQKIYTTGAAEADHIAVWAFNPLAMEAHPDNFLMGFQLNLVPKDSAGVQIHRDWDALGQRATDSGTITFTNVRTDPARRASIPGRAPLPQNSVRYQAGFAACLIGIGLGAVKAAAELTVTKARPWPNANVDNASDDVIVQRLVGELVADLGAAYAYTMATGDLLDAFERGEIDRTQLAVPIYGAKAAASRAGVRAASEVYALIGTRAASRATGLDRFWRNARTLSLHDPVDWKHAEIGQHVLTGWDPPPGIYS